MSFFLDYPLCYIVAVHGLNFKNSNDHARKTWTMSDKLWLKDFLPGALLPKHPRVMLFEYNSSPALGATAIKLSGHANNLLQWLKLKRKNDPQRPLIFICHSLGGLIVKEALVAATLDVTYKSTVEAACLLVFFATPHQGGNYASLGDIVAKIVRTGMSKPRNDLLDALKENSDQAMQRFEQARHLPERCLVVNFYEGDPYGKIGLIVDKKSATLNLPGTREKQIAMHADHSTICKFDSPDNLACELVLGTIADEVERALAMSRSATSIVPSYPLSSMKPVKAFVQRPLLRDSIRNQLTKPLDANRQGEVKRVGVWGMGGAGKSQLALSYLQRYRTEYDATFWIQADQTASIDRDFLSIYRLLAETTPSLCDPNPEDVKREVLGWFARASGKYLIIFDGADSLNQTDKDFVRLSEYCPGSSRTHIIITSRSSIAKSMSTFEGVSVEELEESQSVDLFLTCAGIQPAREGVVAETKLIVHELGYLALAVSMAGKYVSQTPRLSSNLSVYLDEFRHRRKDLLSETPDELVAMYHHSVMTVWEASYSAVSEQLPEAGRLLTLLCFINYDDIFLELFALDIDSGLRAVAPWMSVLGCQMGADLHQLEKWFRVLENYSLCQRKMIQSSYSIHRLVHAWGYDRVQSDGEEVDRYWYAASQLLDGYLKTIGDRQDGLASKLQVVPHLTENVRRFKRASTAYDWNRIDWIEDVERFGIFFVEIGRWNEAALSLREVFQKRQRILGDEHPDTIAAMNNLAITLSDQGKLDEAALMRREVLEKRQRILGDEHPDTIAAMNNLAITLSDQGKLDEAASMMREVLEKRQRILGDEHLDTISAMNNLASTLSGQGKLDEAASMRREVLEKRQRILGDEHPDTISAMSNLASTLSGQGKLDEAASMRREVLEKRQRILGDEHPDTITAINNLANTLSDQGKLDEAASMKREVLKKRQRILGDEHPDTISAMNNLVITLRNQGKLDEAVLMTREVLEKRQRILGDEHPDTISAMNNLAITLSDQGKLDEAASMMREVFENMQRILGDEHPDTITAMNNLASMLSDQGKLDEAVLMTREVLEKRQRILGDEHPDTISAMNNLAITLSDQGKLDEAASMMREVFENMQRILGDEHPDTITAMHNLANTLSDQGKLDEAASMRREVLEKRQRILGDEHPDTISAMSNLASTLSGQGKLDEAASMRREVLEKRQRILGDEHPDTISAMNNLAITLSDQGKLDEAASMMREVFENMQRVLGDEHPYTTRAAECLRFILSALSVGPSDTSTTKKQPFLKRVTGKLQQVRDSFRSSPS
ncbi:hypothetical protein BKA59DRAFT_321505 [Fusarium tricinctum]|uniref:NB-ARC domain-containing protein n=1 Tax=Fusarium tricinctum TaxID=61284 RepID=A0A8K0W4Z3_9HYPO|nr:hypothetical protein BKA59DRAFT_321505 [Fusarium tricinctum]